MKNFTISLALVIFLLPTFVLAANTYEPLVGIPGVDPSVDFSGYINSLYVLSISIAALLAVIKIIIAGVKWMMTDIVTTKGEAKKDIQGALIGLLIVLAAVLILTVINPKLVEVNLQLKPMTTQPLNSSGGNFVAAPITSHAGYDSVAVADKVGGDVIQTFIDDCADSDGHYQLVGSMEYRCYSKQPNQNVSVQPVCNTTDLCIGSDSQTACQAKINICESKKTTAEETCSQKQGVFTADDERINATLYGACVY